MQPGKCSLGKGTVSPDFDILFLQEAWHTGGWNTIIHWELMSLKCPRSSDDGCWWLVLTFALLATRLFRSHPINRMMLTRPWQWGVELRNPEWFRSFEGWNFCCLMRDMMISQSIWVIFHGIIAQYMTWCIGSTHPATAVGVGSPHFPQAARSVELLPEAARLPGWKKSGHRRVRDAAPKWGW